jgi:hypothetical protein
MMTAVPTPTMMVVVITTRAAVEDDDKGHVGVDDDVW